MARVHHVPRATPAFRARIHGSRGGRKTVARGGSTPPVSRHDEQHGSGLRAPVPHPEALRAEADALAREEAPRLFAVLALDHEEGDGVIIAWGQLFRNGHVTLTGAAFPVRGSFGSLRSALRFCERGTTDTHITWIDQEPAPNRSVAYDPRTGNGKTHEPHKTRSVGA